MSSLQSVFGHDVKLDENGNPIEKGFGALKKAVERVVSDVEVELSKLLGSAKGELEAVKAERDKLEKDLDDAKVQIDALTVKLAEATAVKPQDAPAIEVHDL